MEEDFRAQVEENNREMEEMKRAFEEKLAQARAEAVSIAALTSTHNCYTITYDLHTTFCEDENYTGHLHKIDGLMQARRNLMC